MNQIKVDGREPRYVASWYLGSFGLIRIASDDIEAIDRAYDAFGIMTRHRKAAEDDPDNNASPHIQWVDDPEPRRNSPTPPPPLFNRSHHSYWWKGVQCPVWTVPEWCEGMRA